MKNKNGDLGGKKKPINGMSVETFVRGYEGQSQMNVNTIAGLGLSGYGNKRINEIYKTFQHQK